jgi:hypothetical protein
VIEMNIGKTRLHVVKPKKKAIPAAAKGGAKVLSLFLNGSDDAIASDDRRFLRKLESANIPYLTPAACLVYPPVALSGPTGTLPKACNAGLVDIE